MRPQREPDHLVPQGFGLCSLIMDREATEQRVNTLRASEACGLHTGKLWAVRNLGETQKAAQ